jgi:hypothetical protein
MARAALARKKNEDSRSKVKRYVHPLTDRHPDNSETISRKKVALTKYLGP